MVEIECPYCSATLKLQPPDRSHVAFSLEKPMQSSFHGEITEKRQKCVNCKGSFTVFWYAPLEYFTRV